MLCSKQKANLTAANVLFHIDDIEIFLVYHASQTFKMTFTVIWPMIYEKKIKSKCYTKILGVELTEI